jgi:protein-S-isoprenylcysteine O-methyltransferase Ste14
MVAAGARSLGSNLTPFPHPRDDVSLQTVGVFHLVRHPIYGGLILLIAGYCLALPSMPEIAFAVCTVIFFDRKAAREERWLRERFPAYGEYSTRTKRFVPWVY